MSTPTTPTRGLRRYWIGGILALGIIGVVVALSSLRAAAPADGILGVTRVSEGPATVALTPKEHVDGRLVVEIAVNTHTVDDLDRYDLTAITTLDAAGAAVAPVSAPELAGHHNSGELVFPLESLPDALTIVIRGLDEPGNRVFTWP